MQLQKEASHSKVQCVSNRYKINLFEVRKTLYCESFVTCGVKKSSQEGQGKYKIFLDSYNCSVPVKQNPILS